MIVTEVQGGSNGNWTGIGYTEIPYLADTKIAVEFKGASINDCYEYTGGGTVQSAYDPSWGNVINLDRSVQPILAEIRSLLNAKLFEGDSLNMARYAIINLLYGAEMAIIEHKAENDRRWLVLKRATNASVYLPVLLATICLIFFALA